MVSVASLDSVLKGTRLRPLPVVQPFPKHCADVGTKFTIKTVCSNFVLSHGIFHKAKKKLTE